MASSNGVFVVACLLTGLPFEILEPSFYANAILVKKPDSTLACDGNTMIPFYCETNDEGLEWKYRSADPTKLETQYPYTSFETKQGYSVNKSDNGKAVELKIQKVTTDSAGLYTCNDLEGVGDVASAQLVVIKSMKWDSTVENTTMNACVTVEYRGNIHPTAHCRIKDSSNCTSFAGKITSAGDHTREYCTVVDLSNASDIYECSFSLKPTNDCSSDKSRNTKDCQLSGMHPPGEKEGSKSENGNTSVDNKPTVTGDKGSSGTDKESESEEESEERKERKKAERTDKRKGNGKTVEREDNRVSGRNSGSNPGNMPVEKNGNDSTKKNDEMGFRSSDEKKTESSSTVGQGAGNMIRCDCSMFIMGLLIVLRVYLL